MTIEAMYDEFLNDSYGLVRIGSLVFEPAEVLKACDPIAYRVGLSDYESWIEGDDD